MAARGRLAARAPDKIARCFAVRRLRIAAQTAAPDAAVCGGSRALSPQPIDVTRRGIVSQVACPFFSLLGSPKNVTWQRWREKRRPNAPSPVRSLAALLSSSRSDLLRISLHPSNSTAMLHAAIRCGKMVEEKRGGARPHGIAHAHAPPVHLLLPFRFFPFAAAPPSRRNAHRNPRTLGHSASASLASLTTTLFFRFFATHFSGTTAE